ncbi:EndoU domain-containing protein [Terasakiella sp. SH-1]|uniref:EndoU domain-containing protein n=1 Tax=Terasakiella sp. SH-1 TaxID=2560057 RepID=UPI00142FDA89|nr:EndoU domain-containing protein [Terasakiella sp. SH-1]
MSTPLNLLLFPHKTIRAARLGWQAAFLLCCFSPIAWAADWSDTEPSINITHIFEGEINKKGRPVGYHARPFGRDPEHAEVDGIISGPNRVGVYTARVEIYDAKRDVWRSKAFSSFFPDQLSKKQVVDQILFAYKGSRIDKRGKWRGRSTIGFTIEGWLCPKGGTATCPDGAINTAYPIYRKDR